MASNFQALSRYKPMWIYVMFDLPTNTKQQRKAASDFRKELLKDGFSMLQYSVYIRNCASYENTLVHITRIKNLLPEEGIVSILKVTDRQFGDTCTFVGHKTAKKTSTLQQLEFF